MARAARTLRGRGGPAVHPRQNTWGYGHQPSGGGRHGAAVRWRQHTEGAWSAPAAQHQVSASESPSLLHRLEGPPRALEHVRRGWRQRQTARCPTPWGHGGKTSLRAPAGARKDVFARGKLHRTITQAIQDIRTRQTHHWIENSKIYRVPMWWWSWYHSETVQRRKSRNVLNTRHRTRSHQPHARERATRQFDPRRSVSDGEDERKESNSLEGGC